MASTKPWVFSAIMAIKEASFSADKNLEAQLMVMIVDYIENVIDKTGSPPDIMWLEKKLIQMVCDWNSTDAQASRIEDNINLYYDLAN